MKRVQNKTGSGQVVMPFAKNSEVGEGLKFKNVIFLLYFSKDSGK